jgi:predicted ATPase
VLVVLDNCEHVLDGAADLVEDLLRMTPMLRVLATSREGLSLDGEHLVAVPGLDGSTAESAGVALLLDRARSADASFELGADQLEVVAEICRRLDGLPLAIELAAARVGVLTPADLLGRLDERFTVLTGGRRRRSRDRQRTLRDTVDWSYRLLDGDEQRVFATLSVFAGSFDLDGAAAVLEEHDRVEVLDLVEALVDKSLLMVTDVDGLRRYRYLETLRSYAEERLEERGNGAALRLLLYHHLCSVVVHSVDEMVRRSNRGAALLRAEIPNLRRVFDDALDRGDVAAATAVIAPFAEMVGGIDWRITGWAAEALALAESADSRQEPYLLALEGIDQWLHGGFGNLHRLAEQMLERAASFGDVPYAVEAVAECFFQLTGDDKAVGRLAASRTTRLGRVDPDRLLRLRQIDIWCHLVPAQSGATPELDAEELAVIETMLAHPSAYLRGLGSLLAALDAQRTRRPTEMLAMGDEAASLLVVGSSLWFASLQIRAWAEWELGEYSAAIRTADDHLDHAYNHGDRSAMIMPLLVFALVLHSLGEVEAAATVRGRLPRRMTFVLVSQLARLDHSLIELLEPDRRAELFELGHAMDPRHLQALTHTAAARHIQLEPSSH